MVQWARIISGRLKSMVPSTTQDKREDKYSLVYHTLAVGRAYSRPIAGML